MMNDEGGDSSYLRYPTFVLLKISNLLPDPLMEKPRSTTFENQLIELESVDSTNNYAMGRVHEGLARDGMVCLARHQWAGKGQRGKTWQSEHGQNLNMSMVVEPFPLILSRQFLFSAAVALGILDTVRSIEKNNWLLKWPNDIYWNDRKAAGILIESVIQGQDWPFAVVGVGMNLNQEVFPAELSHAISLKQITGRHYDPVSVARDMVPAIQHQISILRKHPSQILADYNRSLYKKGQPIVLKTEHEMIITDLKGVDDSGKLFTENGSFSYGEVEWIITH
jgi:BirA family biotin operon repressor/biotin-[acetyl-CoA-carboxylase] ligase